MTALRHGGALDAAIARHGGARADWLDLSTGINPVAWPVPQLDADAWTRLPDKAALQRCLEAARRFYGVAADAAIVAAPGTQAIIQRIASLRPQARRAAVLSPTYGEHAAVLARAGLIVEEVDELAKAGNADIVVVVNPNNPDGREHAPEVLAAFAEQLALRGGLLVVDEAFGEVTPHLSVCGLAGRESMLVLRSFGKFFGLAGLRLGFAVGGPETVARLAADLGPWAVSGPALEIGARALNEKGWFEVTWARLSRDAAALRALLVGHDFKILGGTDLFVLAARADAADVAERLARAHVLVRSFDGFANRLRFGLPADEAGFRRLGVALR